MCLRWKVLKITDFYHLFLVKLLEFLRARPHQLSPKASFLCPVTIYFRSVLFLCCWQLSALAENLENCWPLHAPCQPDPLSHNSQNSSHVTRRPWVGNSNDASRTSVSGAEEMRQRRGDTCSNSHYLSHSQIGVQLFSLGLETAEPFFWMHHVSAPVPSLLTFQVFTNFEHSSLCTYHIDPVSVLSLSPTVFLSYLSPGSFILTLTPISFSVSPQVIS